MKRTKGVILDPLKVSLSFVRENPDLFPEYAKRMPSSIILGKIPASELTANMPLAPKSTHGSGIAREKQEKAPNKTEAAFQLWLEHQGLEIKELRYESMTLRIGRRRYTADYSGWVGGILHLWEVKGSQKWDDSLVKFDVFKACFREIIFAMYGRIDGKWEQIR